MDKPVMNLTVLDLLGELAATLETTEDGLTTREVCLAMGMPPTKSNMAKLATRIGDLIILGVAERCSGRKLTVGMDNVGRPVSAWKLKKEAAKEE